MLSLTWNDVDLKQEQLSVNKTVSYIKNPDKPEQKSEHIVTSPKTASSVRIVPLLPDVTNMLKRISKKQVEHKLKAGSNYKDNNLVFCTSRGTYIPPRTMKQYLDSIAQRTNIDSLSMHCLRHTFATRCFEKGIEMKVVQEFLGHSSIKMTADTYTQVLPSKRTDSIMKLADTINI